MIYDTQYAKGFVKNLLLEQFKAITLGVKLQPRRHCMASNMISPLRLRM